MPTDLRPTERRAPRPVDRRSEYEKARDEKNERFLVQCVCCSWYGAGVLLVLGCILYLPAAWIAGILG